jgi:very-short-patch-repair endonuclease
MPKEAQLAPRLLNFQSGVANRLDGEAVSHRFWLRHPFAAATIDPLGMTNIARMVASLGGMAQKQQLVKRGASDWDLTHAVRGGRVERARQGWYTTLAPDDPRVIAVRVGGRLTGISAIVARGGWVLRSHPLHVSVPFNAARLRSQADRHRRFKPNPGVEIHWDSPELSDRGSAMVVTLFDALAKVIVVESRETAIAALDWALHTGLIDEFDFAKIMSTLPQSRRFGFEWLDAKCESLPESLARSRLLAAGHHVVSQVELATGGPIDLVVDGIVAIETDGKEHHADHFESDRRKDLRITLAGYHGMRPSATMVFHEWPAVLEGIEVALAARRIASNSGNSGVVARKRAVRRRKPPNSTVTPEFAG